MLTKLIVKTSFLGGQREVNKQPTCQNCSSISNCTTREYKGYDIYNKKALFAWKYEVSFDPVF